MACGYALLVEAHQQIGADLMTAVERARESIYGPSSEDVVPDERDNAVALAELQKMMSGVARE